MITLKILFIFIIISSFFASCSNSSTSPESAAVSTTPIPETPIKKRSTFKQVDAQIAFDKFKKEFGSAYSEVLLASFIDNQLFFYVINGKWDNNYMDSQNRTIKKGGYQVGLVNEKNEIVIPIKYDKIYNLGGTAANLIEVELNGKLGAYDLEGHELLRTEFDAIYPYKGAAEVWVQVRRGDQFGWLSKTGALSFDKSSHSDPNLFQTPAFSSLISAWNFSSESETLLPVFEYNPSAIESPDDQIDGIGILFTPSYLVQLGICPEFYSSWLFDGGDFGLESTIASVESSKEVAGGISALMTAFDASFMDARGYHTEDKSVVTVNKKMEKVDKLAFPIKDYNEQRACNSGVQFKMIGTDILEVCVDEPTDYALYSWSMTTYHYYKIAADGKINKMNIPGDFKFTRILNITDKYFQGCYARDLTKAEESQAEDGPAGFMISSHLSIQDLDVMRNEIFAAHGYKFKNAQWQAHFGKKSWYKPQFDNVDDKLSDIEKHNIQVILDMKQKMEGKEAQFVKKEFGYYAAAG